MKQLSAFLETLQNNKAVAPCNLEFYIRDKDNKATLKSIKIYLREREIREAVLNILKTCSLSTDYVDKIPKPTYTRQGRSFNMNPFERGDINMANIREDDPIFGPLIKQKINKARESQTLKSWINKHYTTANENSEHYKPIKDNIATLIKELTQQWGIMEIRWECGWNESHYKACLQGLKCIAEQYPHVMHILRGIRKDFIFVNFYIFLIIF